MKKHVRYICAAILTIIIFFTVDVVFCAAADKNNTEHAIELTAGRIVLSEDTYHVTIQLSGTNVQSGKLEAQMLDSQGNSIETISCAPEAEIEMEFAYSDDLDTVVISWSGKNSVPLCESLTLTFDRIYAADWKALANAIHRMDLLYGEKVQAEDESSEYASGRLIVKTKEELPDVSEFHAAVIVIDDEEHCFLQFEKSDDAKKCAEYLKTSPNIEYVDIDGVVTIS